MKRHFQVAAGVKETARSTGRLDGGSAQEFREFLEKNVVLVAGEDHYNSIIDADDDDPVFVAIVVDVSGYGPHTGAISTQQNRFHGHPDAPLQTAYEILEEWMIENDPEHFAELEKEYGDEASSVLTETFNGRTWKMSAREFADAIKGTDAEKFIEVHSEEEDEGGELEEAHEEEGDPPVIRISYTRITWGDSEDSDDYEEDHGWIDEDGVEFEPDESDVEDGMTESESIVNQAAAFLKKEGVVEPSSSAFHTGIWYSTEYQTIDYGTGEEEERSFHLDGFSPEEEAEIYKQVTNRRR